MTMRRLLACMLLSLVGSTSLPAAEWTLQAGTLAIAARYEGQPVPAVFHRFAVRFDDDPANPQLQVDIDVASIDFDSADINEAVVGEAWFDVARYPRARFVSTRIESLNPDHFLAHGELELKGIRRAVAVPFSWTIGNGRGHLQGHLQLQRGDFQIGTGEWAAADEIGQAVDIRFDLRLRRVVEDSS
jgi:polyisoprenoid-binding protein YceI